MRRIVVGDCIQEGLLHLADPDAPSEAEFESQVARALSCFFPNHRCVAFTGAFRLDTEVYRPDLALFASDFSHWFVIEVELVSHSFECHVLPQVRAFRYGEPLDDCVAQISKVLSISAAQAVTLIRHVPRSVAVVANKLDTKWKIALGAHNIQLIAVSTFSSLSGLNALEIEGDLDVFLESLGFGVYSATDRSLRFPKSVRVPTGQVQISDPLGGTALWTVARDDLYAWITKDTGSPSIANGSLIQILRTVDGRITLKRP